MEEVIRNLQKKKYESLTNYKSYERKLVIDVAHNLLGNVSVIQKVFKEGLVPGAIALMVLILTVFIIFRIIVFVFFEVI